MLGFLFTFASFILVQVSAATLPPIEILGNKFFTSNDGSQFFMRGIAYQSDASKSNEKFVDLLADYSACSRDIPYLQRLRTNVIRVYSVDATADHSQCMQALNDAGIYVIADLSEPELSINRNNPEWNTDLYKRYTSVVDSLQQYSNVLGFFAGNEVSNVVNNTDASAYVKAAIRDVKAYIKQKGYRKIPVGYSTNDDKDIREDLYTYFSCGDEDVRADFYGVNIYEWCGRSSYELSGYKDRTDEYRNSNIPVFFSEYGCNLVSPRLFTEVGTLFGDEMTGVWSGGIVYMYHEEPNHYGLVSIGSDEQVTTLPDFNYYSSEIANISPTGVNSRSYTPSVTSVQCTFTSEWRASTSLPPTPDESRCSCMFDSLSCIINDDVDTQDYQKIFEYACHTTSCKEISSNAVTGEYGSFSFCNNKQKLSNILNSIYVSSSRNPASCNFNGSARIVSASGRSSCTASITSSGSSQRPSSISTSTSRAGVQPLNNNVPFLFSGLMAALSVVAGMAFAWF